MHTEDERISLLCAGPVGCAFMLIVEQNNLSPEKAATPDIAQTIAGHAVNAVWEHNSDHAELVAHVLSHGWRLQELARALLSQPDAASWFAPLDREAQMWVGVEGRLLDLDRHVSLDGLSTCTSTIVGELSAELIAKREGAGDYRSMPPYTRYHLRAAADARVFEVTGPAAWHALCLESPALDPDGSVVPDRSAVARKWDAVHVPLGGLLTAHYVPVPVGSSWTQLNGWEAEHTLWFHNRLEQVERWPDLSDDPPARDDVAPWWYWGPTWNDDPKPWRTQLSPLGFDPGEDGTDI